MKSRRYLRFAALGLAVLALAWLLPYALSAERYRRLVQSRLEQALGRQVAFGSIAFKLVPRPGFSLYNVVVRENSAFGSEPFARVDEIDCDLAVWSLLQGRIGLARLSVRGATISLVRDADGRWNVEPAQATGVSGSPPGKNHPALTIDVDDARLNFKFGSEIKPFAVTGLNGRVSFDPSRGEIGFDLTGFPARTDLGLPSPGKVALAGTLALLAGHPGTLDARLNTRGGLLYDWIPLAFGRNPQVYGLLDADVRLVGSLRLFKVTAQARLTQLRRWESLPPAGSFPVTIDLQGILDRDAGEAALERLAVSFGQSRLSLAGTVTGLGSGTRLSLKAAVDHSQWDDFLSLSSRLAGWSRGNGLWNLTGIFDASVGIAGPWSAPRLTGSLITTSGRLTVGGARLPFTDAEVRFDGRYIELLPMVLTATPDLNLTAEASLNLSADSAMIGQARRESRIPRLSKPATGPGYELSVSVRSASVHELLGLARDAGMKLARDVDAQGLASASMVLARSGWPPARPTVSAQAEIRDTRLLVPGLVRPVEIHNAHLEFHGDHFTVNPFEATFGGTTFTGRLEHVGKPSLPWTFEARSRSLNLAEAATWLEALGRRPNLPWFARIPGLNTLAERQAAGTDLFNALHASGSFATAALTYGQTTLRNFDANIDIAHRVVNVTAARFRGASGRGQGTAEIDFGGLVPRLSSDFSLTGLRVENWSSHLPPQLEEMRGSAAISGHVSASGTSQRQLQSSAQGHLRIRLSNVELGHFDPVRAAAHAAAWGEIAPGRFPLIMRSAELSLELRDRELVLKPVRMEVGGAVFLIDGQVGFDRSARIRSTADLQQINRRWLDDRDPSSARVASFLLSGPLDGMTATLANRAGGLAP